MTKTRQAWQRPWTLADLVRDPSLVHEDDESALDRLGQLPSAVSPSRRGLLKGVGGLFAMSALAGCSRAPKEKILPYNRTPPELVPGVPSFYATALETDGYAIGVIAELNDGRPTKIEGNPDHPASLGATFAREQAAIWQLYDPDRAKETTEAGSPASFERLAATLRERAARGSADGAGIALLFPASTSRILADALATLRAKLPKLRVHFYSAGSPRATWEAVRLVTGTPGEVAHDLRAARVIASFDCDFLADGPHAITHARHFSEKRKVSGSGASTTEMNRLYVVEPAPTVTGSSADHRRAVRPDAIAQAVSALVALLADQGLPLPAPIRNAALAQAGSAYSDPASKHWLSVLARDLLLRPHESVLMVGRDQPAALHALALLVNQALSGPTAVRTSPILEAGTSSHDLRDLTAAMNAGAIDTLVVLGGNPAYASATEMGFTAAMSNVPTTVYLAPYVDETAMLARWVVPAAQALEMWRDGASVDGTWSVAQPVISPLTEGRTPFDLVNALLDASHPLPSAHEALQAKVGAGRPWNLALTRGHVEGTRLTELLPPTSDEAAIARALAAIPPPKESEIALSLPFDNFVRDGQMANCPWLLELPHPTDKTAWGNTARVSPALAASLDLSTGDVVRLTSDGRSVETPVRVTRGMADRTVSLSLGFGRRGGEANARDVGANGFVLAGSDGERSTRVVAIIKTGRREVVAATQEHFTLEGREDEVVPEIALADLRAGAARANLEEKRTQSDTLYAVRPGTDRAKRQWGMTIDLNACTGCQACVLACQVENNVPTVGKEGVAKGREMHWLRIDRYEVGEENDPHTIAQPMLCQHCEKAPCEYVCPVGATTHSSEGLNQMTYNRCVGTRFCSNNCPYKVRRFNWFDYHDDEPEILKLGRNPDVTVRDRGVMEKCTFCVQRIRGAQQSAEVEGRDERTDEFTSACAQACPSRAITFGNLADPKSAVSQRWNEPRVYAVLHDLGTDPRVRYAARVRNPNPELALSSAPPVDK